MKKKLAVAAIAFLFLVTGAFTAAELSLKPPAVQAVPPGAGGDVFAQLIDQVKNESPRAALASLAEMRKDGRLDADGCHDAAHEIGHGAYKKYDDFSTAMEYVDEICNSGYIHGVLEEYFAAASDPYAAMRHVCDAYPSTTFRGWECHHGVGHGLMLSTSNDLPKALTLCDSYGDADARSACVNGIFMENFNTDQDLHKSAYLDADDPSFPCAKQSAEHKLDCYFYAPTYFLQLHPREYGVALRWCRSMEPGYAEECAAGVGSQTMKEHIDDPRFAEAVCALEEGPARTECIQGMIGLRIFHFGSLEAGTNVCGDLEKTDQDACRNAARAYEGLFR